MSAHGTTDSHKGKHGRNAKERSKKGAPPLKHSDTTPEQGGRKSKKGVRRSESSLSAVSARSAISSHEDRKNSKASVRINERSSRRATLSARSIRLRNKWKSISRAASLVGSIASVESRGRPKTFPVWPEFSETEIASEKWDSAAKGKEKGKSPSPLGFEDPEGKIDLPPSLKIHEWKRPVDFLEGKTPVVVEENEGDFDLLKPNEHLCHSELMRCIIGQITSLWNMSAQKAKHSSTSSARHSATPEPPEDGLWRPWDHIYALSKQPKGPSLPQYNQYGKYVVRLFWMGCWRKITVDDYMPFDSEGKLLLPALADDCKLWPMILAKALVKVAAIDYSNNDTGCEFGDFFVIHCLTGWVPETIPLKKLVFEFMLHKEAVLRQLASRQPSPISEEGENGENSEKFMLSGEEWYGHLQKVWDLLKTILPEWQRPEEKLKGSIAESETSNLPAPPKKDRLESGTNTKADSSTGSAQKGSKGKEGKRASDKDKKPNVDHDVEKVEKHPETVVFASFTLPEESPARVSVLKEMADASENLRRIGLSHLHPHPVLLTQTRGKPLKPPPPPPVIPKWKLIRPKKKRNTPSDEPIPEPEPPKPDQWLEISSAFLNHRISPLSVDPNVLKSRTSPLIPKASRPSTGATLKGIDEDTEIKIEPPKEDGVYMAQHVPSSGIPLDSEQKLERSQSQIEQNDDGQLEGAPSLTNDVQVEAMQPPTITESSLESSRKAVWMDFEDFCKSFQTLVIFHKPATYACNQSMTEIKHSLITGVPSGGGTSSKKGSANINHSSSSANLKSAGSKEDERSAKYLFIDNIEPSEVIVSFSVLPRWSGSESERDKKISDKESVTGASEIVSIRESGNSNPVSGLLIAEPYSWKSLVVGQPILRIRTTGIRAACLTLPAGRHVLRFFYDTPLGYSLNLCSSVNFVYGDEEDVMKPLVEESDRFVHTANNIIHGVGKCIECLGDVEAWNTARRALHQAHMPYQARSKKELIDHYQIWHKAFYEIMMQVMADNRVPALAFALRSFNFDLSPQATESLAEPKETSEIHENWVNRTPSDDELKAIHRIQRYWRGAMARRMRRAITKKDTTEHTTSRDILNNAWQLIQPNMKSIGLKLLRSMLKQDHALIEKYPFHKDEWNKISYADYAGICEDQHPNMWFVMFRETFTVEEDTLCVPKLYCSLRTCSLRVIDNDTGVEIMRVFQKVAPHVYHKNKRGYTFLCEARSLDTPLQSVRWRLRLIGSSCPLPQPLSGQVNHHFKIKENFGYYMPNEKNIILRYHVKTKCDLISTIHLQTSKPDVYVKLQVLDDEEEIASAHGKGHCVLPALYFFTDDKSDERSPSRLSQADTRTVTNQASKQGVSGKKRTSSAKSKDGKRPKESGDSSKGQMARLETQSIASEDISFEPTVPHKYAIQAVVERNSWPLSESQWAYVQKLREQEKEEIKVYTGNRIFEKPQTPKQDRPGSPARAGGAGGKAATAPDKGKKAKGGDKGGKEKKTQEKESGSRPQSQNFQDLSKASWVLNVVVDDDRADDIDVKKDVDRQEQIKAEKRAWEAQQPGRAVKALQARLAYLEKHSKKVEKDSDKENEDEPLKSEDVSDVGGLDIKDEILTLAPPRSPTPKVILDPLDLTPFYSSKLTDGIISHYLDDEILVQKEQREVDATNKYERERQSVLEWREKEKNDRLQVKIDQIRTFQEMQNKLDDSRAELRKPREAYRQALLEEERKRKEEEELKNAELAAAEASSGMASPKGKKSAGKKKK